MELPDHGANPIRLYKAAELEMPEEFIDFSENVHSIGPPTFIEQRWNDMLPLISRYPDPEAEPFRSAAANFHGVDKEQVQAGNGAAEIFTWLARRYSGKRVVLVEPAFSEYRKTLEAENVEVQEVQLSSETEWKLPLDELAVAVRGSAALYICNPHNPTGGLVTQQNLRMLMKTCLQADCELVVDEAFIDFVGEQFSVISEVDKFPNLIVVRSMTKMYAIPGLRLGYVVSEKQVGNELKQGAAQWNVNALSAEIGARCFAESAYRKQVRNLVVEQRRLMEHFLKQQGCEITASVANFLSFRLPEKINPADFFEGMLKKGLVLRHTHSFKGMDGRWFRIGMKSKTQMEELREGMANWLRGR